MHSRHIAQVIHGTIDGYPSNLVNLVTRLKQVKGSKNKLLKGLTDHDVLAWEEEKMRYQRRVGEKVTDLRFLRYLLVRASRPVISSKEGVASGFLTGHGPLYDKRETHSDASDSAEHR